MPDGLLCAGGDRNKAGLDVPSATWRRTRLAPSENIASFPWIDDGSFVQPGFRAQAGEQVRFRVMGGASSGKEVVDVRHPVTEHDADPAVWAKQMADQVNRQYGSVVRIGVRSGNTIDFDAAHPEANKIWLKPDYSSSLSLIGRD